MRNRFPNLFVPGAGKSGTSSLHVYLDQHPDICMSDVKEPHYFSNDYYFNNHTDRYLSLFENGKNAKFIGESSTGYIAFPNVIERISSLCEDPKFIFVLRNPVDRAYSHYNWLVGLGVEDKNFADAFMYDYDTEPDVDKSNFGIGYKYYYQWGRYAHWIERYVNKFCRENVLVITTENMAINTLLTVNSCFTFLGLDPLPEIDTSKVNETADIKHKKILYALLFLDSYLRRRVFTAGINHFIPSPVKHTYQSAYHRLRKSLLSNKRKSIITKLSESEREWVANCYREDIAILKEMLGESFLEWKDFYGKTAIMSIGEI